MAGALVWSKEAFRGRSAVTLSDGSFECAVVGDLPVDLKVAAPGYDSVELPAESITGAVARLQPDRLGFGRVESIDGEAIPDARVLLSRQDREWESSTDQDGNFVVANPPLGALELEVSAPGYQSVTLAGAVRVGNGAESDLGVISLGARHGPRRSGAG